MSLPTIYDGSFPATTMTSADFLAYRNRIYSRTSPGKSFFLHPIPAASTIKRLGILGTLQWCACLSSLYSLIYQLRFSFRQMSTGHLVLLHKTALIHYSSVPDFAVYSRSAHYNVFMNTSYFASFNACLTTNHLATY